MDNDETENAALESDLRRHFQRRFEPLQHNAVLWSRVSEQITPPRPLAPPAPKPRFQKLLPLAGTVALVLLVAWVTVSSGLLPLALLGNNAPLADALDGAVIIRGGEKPGLYVYGSNGWSYVEGSDKDSRLRARCSDGDLLIDVPNSGDPLPTINPKMEAEYSDSAAYKEQFAAMSRRRLVRTTPTGAHRTDLAFNLGEWEAFQCAHEGVLASNLANSMDGPQEMSFTQPADLSVSYQPANSVSLIVPDLGDHTYILTASPHGRLLLAETSGKGKDWRMRLFAADADGGNRTFLQERNDIPWLATSQFSPDAHYAIMTVYALNITGIQIPYRTLLFDTQADPKKPLLAEYGFDLAKVSSMDNIIGLFVRNGPRAGQLWINQSHGSKQQFRVYDPAAPDKPLIDVSALTNCSQRGFFATDRDSSALAFGCRGAEDNKGTLFYIAIDGSQQVVRPNLGEKNIWWNAAIRNGYIITLLGPESYMPGETPKTQLFLLPLDLLGTTEAWPTVARQAPVGSTLRDLALGRKRMAYVANGELYVSNYDGSGEIMVESQVEGISAAWADIAP